VRAAQLIVLLLLALSALAWADEVTGFQDIGFTVTISVNNDGSARVQEDVTMLVSSTSVDQYKDSLKSTRLTMDDWAKITGSKNLRYHILGEGAQPTNTRLYPKPLQYYEYVNKSLATISVEYDISGQVFTLSEAGPRKTRYGLREDVLSFENAPEGQIIPEDAVLIIHIPMNSYVNLEQTFPPPSKPEGMGTTYEREYAWNATGGAIPITPFDFEFILEETLDEEVSGFFTEMQQQIVDLLFSNYGLLVIVLAGIFVALFMLLKQADLI